MSPLSSELTARSTFSPQHQTFFSTLTSCSLIWSLIWLVLLVVLPRTPSFSFELGQSDNVTHSRCTALLITDGFTGRRKLCLFK